MLIEIWQEDFLIGEPRGACDKNLRWVLINKSCHRRYVLTLVGNGGNAVETCVTGDVNVMDADGGKQSLALFILHEEMSEALEYVSVCASVPTEENLIRTEDAADAIDGHTAMAQDVHVVIPKFVLDEEGE